MRRDTKLIAVAVLLIAVAAVLFARHFSSSSENTVKPPTAVEVQKQITTIQNDPHMPEQAKAIAIGQLKAHSGGQGAPVQPNRPGQ